MKNLYLLLIVSIFIGCSGGKFVDISKTMEALKVNEAGSEHLYSEADAVILFSITDVDVSVMGNTITTTEVYHEAKKIFKNIENYSSVEINIYNEEKLKNIKARTIKPNGEEVALEAKDFYTITGVGGDNTFYSDNKKVRFTFPAIEKGAILEYSFEKFKARPFVTDVWSVQEYLPILKNKFTIRIPKLLLTEFNFDWKFKAYNYYLDNPVMDDPKFAHTNKGAFEHKTIFSWELDNIPPFIPDPKMPPHRSYVAYVRFAPSDWKSWNDISTWYYKRLFQPRLNITNNIKELAARLTASAESTEDKIEKLYDYVKDIRYIAISLGVGSIQPSEPQTVLDRKYGDCKDKSILLIALLNAAGIDAHPALVLTSSEGETDPSFPSWSFNHMIVKAEDENKEVYWMDPTSKYSPLKHLPYQCEGINALVIGKDGKSKIEKTPASKFEDNNLDINIESKINYAGSSEFSVLINASGINNVYYRNIFEDKTDKEMKEYFKSLLMEEFYNSNITSYSLSDYNDNKKSLQIEFNFAADQVIRSQGDLYMVNIDPFKFTESGSWMIKDTRNYPLNFRFPYKLNKKVNITLPENFAVRNLPTKINSRNDYFEYARGFDVSGENQIILEEEYLIRAAKIPAKSFNAIKTNFNNINNKYQEKIILKKN
jgi:hypothetical protein